MSDIEWMDKIEQRCNAATPGPWKYTPRGTIIGHSKTEVCSNARVDAEFITHAREDIPRLITLARRAVAAEAENELLQHQKEGVVAEAEYWQKRAKILYREVVRQEQAVGQGYFARDSLVKEIERLRTENDAREAQIQSLGTMLRNGPRSYDEVVQENERLREALAFYADKVNHSGNACCGDNKVNLDRGAIARKALEVKE